MDPTTPTTTWFCGHCNQNVRKRTFFIHRQKYYNKATREWRQENAMRKHHMQSRARAVPDPLGNVNSDSDSDTTTSSEPSSECPPIDLDRPDTDQESSSTSESLDESGSSQSDLESDDSVTEDGAEEICVVHILERFSSYQLESFKTVKWSVVSLGKSPRRTGYPSFDQASSTAGALKAGRPVLQCVSAV
uniref:Uncharacterized protein n=1 Tax=Branchiostoma floridae TaxID=7739 RepID=C3ZUP5_BRAFL|eukprot:XP_002587746.1 hypothetical protein BRAFLDRAFT_94650 [Branchiostoma floridae]